MLTLAVQWLGLGALTAGARVQSLVGELRSHRLRSAAKKKINANSAKKKKKKKKGIQIQTCY